MVNDFYLQQLVRESTCDNHMLDLIFCTDPARVTCTSVSVIPDLDISDHEAVLFNFNMKPLWYQNSIHCIYLYHRGDFDRIRQHRATFQILVF